MCRPIFARPCVLHSGLGGDSSMIQSVAPTFDGRSQSRSTGGYVFTYSIEAHLTAPPCRRRLSTVFTQRTTAIRWSIHARARGFARALLCAVWSVRVLQWPYASPLRSQVTRSNAKSLEYRDTGRSITLSIFFTGRPVSSLHHPKAKDPLKHSGQTKQRITSDAGAHGTTFAEYRA